jgi:hypothetical protein
MKLSPEDKLILSCVKIQPTPKELEKINNLIPQLQDWDYLITTIIDRGIGPLLYKKLPLLSNSLLIPTSVQTKLQQVYYKTLSRSTILYEHFRKVADAFAEQDISVIALKGIYLSEWLYQDIGLRQFSDIDLLVKEKDGLTALSILTALGYNPESVETNMSELVDNLNETVHYDPMVLNGVSIEIHIKLHQDAEKYELKVNEIWKNAISTIINNTSILALSKNDLLIHLCVHLDKHFQTGHVQFTCFNDITNLLEMNSDNINWNELIVTCKNYNCENVVFKYIVLTNKYMNATVPDYIIQKYESLFSGHDNRLFIMYLKGYTYIGNANQTATHIGNIKKLESFSEKFRYSWEIIFPPKAFMINKYNTQPLKGGKSFQQFIPLAGGTRGHFWWLLYPYRWWIGVKGVIKLIVHS